MKKFEIDLRSGEVTLFKGNLEDGYIPAKYVYEAIVEYTQSGDGVETYGTYDTEAEARAALDELVANHTVCTDAGMPMSYICGLAKGRTFATVAELYESEYDDDGELYDTTELAHVAEDWRA